jgi:hypothetical protein
MDSGGSLALVMLNIANYCALAILGFVIYEDWGLPGYSW